MYNRLSKVVALTVAIFGLAMPALAQDETLVQVGDFSRTFSNVIYGNDEIYRVTCDQGTSQCEDNASNSWYFGTGLPGFIVICEETENVAGPVPCVHVVEINVTTTEPYIDVFVSIQRAGCEVNEVVYDNNKAGRLSSNGSFIGDTSGEELHFMDVSFSIGMITPRKPHALLITSPSDAAAPGCTAGNNAITGIEIFGTPIASQS